MSSRSDEYRQKAAEAKNCAAQTTIPSIISAFEEVARGCLLLAEQMEWIERTLRYATRTRAISATHGCDNPGGRYDGIREELAAGMTKKRRTYQPRIVAAKS